MQVRYQLRHSPKLVLLRGSDRPKQPDQLNRNLHAAPIGHACPLILGLSADLDRQGSDPRISPGGPGEQVSGGRCLWHKKIRRNLSIPADYPVELRGLEPLTPCMPCRCATSCATAPDLRYSVVSPEQLKYLRPAFPKIPNRAYSGWQGLLFGVGSRRCLG